MKIINLIIKILIFKVKIKFSLPKKITIAVFDKTSLNNLANILKKYDYFILPGRYEDYSEIYFNINILKKTLSNLNKGLSLSYNIALIDNLRPKLIITTIDNSYLYHQISKFFLNKIPALAIQLSNRPEIIKNNHFFKKKITKINYNNKFYHNFFSVISKFDLEYFNKNKISIKKSFVNGSLTLANAIDFFKRKKIKLIKNKYDICLISDSFTLKHDELFGAPGWQKGVGLYLKNIIKIIKKNNLSFIFCIKRIGKYASREIDFYKKYLNSEELKFLLTHSTLKKNNDIISPTYKAMFQSNLTISVWSTLLRENMQLKKKSLCVDVDPNKIYSFPIKGLCQISSPSFSKLEKRVLYLLSISNRRYCRLIGSKINYISYTDFRNTIKNLKILIRSLIFLKEKNKVLLKKGPVAQLVRAVHS